MEEVARVFGLHKNTVLRWLKAGLPTIDARKPYLILGRELTKFLVGRQRARRRPCGLGEMFCLRCRSARRPQGSRVAYEPQTALLGNLRGTCSTCGAIMNRRTSAAKLAMFRGHLNVTIPEALLHITESPEPFLNGDFKE